MKASSGLGEALNNTLLCSEKEWYATRSSFCDHVKELPHGNSHYINAKVELVIEKLSGPIGIAVTPNQNIVIGVTGEDQVKIFSNEGGIYIHNG